MGSDHLLVRNVGFWRTTEPGYNEAVDSRKLLRCSLPFVKSPEAHRSIKRIVLFMNVDTTPSSHPPGLWAIASGLEQGGKVLDFLCFQWHIVSLHEILLRSQSK